MNKYNELTKEELIKLVIKQDKELDSKKYGLIWDREKEPEQVVLDCENNLPILERIKNKEIKTNDSDDNIFIEGDNYHSLTVLNYTHKSKIDFIYIDPPYNTGKKGEWKYNDRYIDENDSYRHAKWLNMMEKRLELAKNLLKEDGIIFISIGEQEVSNLNLLCGKIFRHENFLTIISRISKTASDKGNHFAPSCDYVICYAKNKTCIDTSNFYDEVDEDLYTKEDEKGMYRDDIALYQSALDTRPNQRYFIKCPDGSLVIPPGKSMPKEKKEGSKAIPIKGDGVWRWSLDDGFKEKSHLLVFKETKNSPLLNQDGEKARYNIYTKSYLEERRDKGTKPRNFLVDKKFLNRRGSDYLKTLGLDFPYSKPKELIDHLMRIAHIPQDAIVLDFFAGSGTTGEAVLDLNNEDNGNRKFILCTNNEGEIAEEVCYPRIEKIINGYTKKAKKTEKLNTDLKNKLSWIKEIEKIRHSNSKIPKDKRKDKPTNADLRDREGRSGRRSKVAKNRFERFLSNNEEIERPKHFLPLEISFENEEGSTKVFSIKEVQKIIGRKIIGPINFTINYSDRIHIVGKNGSGKTTLIKMLVDEIKNDSGLIERGKNIKIGYISQERWLNISHKTVLEEFLEITKLDESNARRILNRFRITTEDVGKNISLISPGEYSRLVIAELLATKPNCIILDEPSNHLDLEIMEELENALVDYKGTLIVVSHDRYFVNKIKLNKIINIDLISNKIK